MDTKPTTVSETLFLIPPQYKATASGKDRIFIDGDTCFGFDLDSIKNVNIQDLVVKFTLSSAVITLFRNVNCISITIL